MNTHRWNIVRFAQLVGGLALVALLCVMPVAHAATETNAACVSVAIAGQADVAVLNDRVDTYMLTVTNRGGSMIKGVTLNVPVETGYWLAEASFDRSTTWVTGVSDGKVTIRVEGMRGVGDTVKGTLRFAGPASSDVNALRERVTATWSTEEEEFSTQSNLPAFGAHPLALATGQVGQYRVSSDIFAVGEPVTFWYTSAAGVSTPLVIVKGVLGIQPAESDIEEITFCTCRAADALGVVALPLSIAGIPAGSYTLVARGNWSGATATALINVP